MAFAELPKNPNLENLKNQAKSLLKAVRAGDETALGRVGPYFGTPTAIGLQYAQLVIAREYGFSSWKTLKRAVDGSAKPSDLEGDRQANRFLDLVCLAYQPDVDPGPHRFERAAEVLRDNPEIGHENIYTAAAIGDVQQIEHWLARDPGLVNRKGGYFNWEPIMYAAYARLPGASTLSAGSYLLERGADPNAHYMWGGQYKFTALTGVFGQGEGGPINFPEHPDFVEFARALLTAGADPNDSQAAYNRCFEPDNTCLELLLEFGLSSDQRNNWMLEQDGKMLPNPSETMHFHLIAALHRGFSERAKLLIDHGVDLNKPDDTYDTLTKGKTPYEAARLLGMEDIADYLLAKGARKTELSVVDSLQAACMRGDGDRARELLNGNLPLAEAIKPRAREMLCDAVLHGNVAALSLMIELGFELSEPGKRSPLHDAAFHGRLEMARMLLDAGADTKMRESNYASPPLGFALHAGQEDMVALLDDYPMDVFGAAARGKLDQLQAYLDETPDIHETRFSEIRPPEGRSMEMDWMTPLAYAVGAGREEAVRLLLEHGADPTVTDGSGKTILDLAKESGNSAILSLLNDARVS